MTRISRCRLKQPKGAARSWNAPFLAPLLLASLFLSPVTVAELATSHSAGASGTAQWTPSAPKDALAELEKPLPPMGFRPLPREVAAQLVVPLPRYTSFPESLDWRDEGIITPAKSQLGCGACWAFAGIGLLEAMAIKAGAAPGLNLAEQVPISCDTLEFWGTSNDGCCGGSVTIFEYLKHNPGVPEARFPYQAGDFDGDGPRDGCEPNWPTVPCPDPYPPHTGWKVATWGLISEGIPTVAELKSALQNGPVWLGFYVYQDFVDFWYNAGPEDVYTRTSNDLVGGHAVLLIGYRDSKNAWIIKNSWGPTSGPSNDGTCMISYTANCSFGLDAAFITVVQTAPDAKESSWSSIKSMFKSKK